MLTRSDTTRNATALVFSVIWIWIVSDNFFLSPWWLSYAAISVMYALTIFGTYRINRTGQRLHRLILMISMIAAAAAMFTLWGLVIDLPLPEYPSDFPLPIRLSIIFTGGLLASLSVSLLSFYPLTVLMPRRYWLIPMVTALFVAWIQFGALSDTQASESTKQVMLYELLCLCLLVPLLMWFMGSRVRSRRVPI